MLNVSRTFAEDGVLASVRDGEGRTWRYAYGAFDVLQAIEDPPRRTPDLATTARAG